MPVGDVKERIAELERELAVLRLLEQRHRQTAPPNPAAQIDRSRPPERPEVLAGRLIERQQRRRRVSPERQAIIDLLQKNPNGVSPSDVSRALDTSPHAAQTNLSRMVQAGMVQRVEQGLYRLAAHLPE